MDPFGLAGVAFLCLMGAVVLVIDHFEKKKKEKNRKLKSS